MDRPALQRPSAVSEQVKLSFLALKYVAQLLFPACVWNSCVGLFHSSTSQLLQQLGPGMCPKEWEASQRASAFIEGLLGKGSGFGQGEGKESTFWSVQSWDKEGSKRGLNPLVRKEAVVPLPAAVG